VRLKLLPGQRSEIVGVPDLIDGLNFNALIADKAFAADRLRQTLHERGAEAVIPAKCNRKIHIIHDEEAYKWRHLIENYTWITRKPRYNLSPLSIHLSENRYPLFGCMEYTSAKSKSSEA
jgi:transposase